MRRQWMSSFTANNIVLEVTTTTHAHSLALSQSRQCAVTHQSPRAVFHSRRSSFSHAHPWRKKRLCFLKNTPFDCRRDYSDGVRCGVRTPMTTVLQGQFYCRAHTVSVSLCFLLRPSFTVLLWKQRVIWSKLHNILHSWHKQMILFCMFICSVQFNAWILVVLLCTYQGPSRLLPGRRVCECGN